MLRSRTQSSQSSQAISEPSTFKKKVKSLPMTQEKTQNESILLLGNKSMKRYRVFLDEEVGFPASYSDTIHEAVRKRSI